MDKVRMYSELHELKKDKEVMRFLTLLQMANLTDGIESNPIYKMGFSPAFVLTAKQNDFDLYGELISAPLAELAQIFPLSQLEELMLKEASLAKVKEMLAKAAR